MPSARSSASDAVGSLENELALVSKAFGSTAFTGKDWLREFQQVDTRDKGYISSRNDAIETICGAIPPKYHRRVNFDLIMKSFPTNQGHFDYPSFCDAYEKYRTSGFAGQSPSTMVVGSAKSPTKSPHKRSNWLIEQQQAHGTDDDSPRDLGSERRRMRVDPRLESQRLLSRSIQRKLLHGLIGTQQSGFRGLEDLLFYLDEQGEGYVGDDVFEREILRQLKKPLTKQEVDFLLANLRVHAKNTSRPVIHYEHLATLCGLDSDMSAEDTENDAPLDSPDSPTKLAHNRLDSGLVSVGGADLLAAETTLRKFFQQAMPSAQQTSSIENTPRSAVTGAEVFLERAEAIDNGKTGFLDEHVFYSILAKYDLGIASNLVRTMLEKFPRSGDQKVNYKTFLERYGENPELARQRRRLKRLLSSVIAAEKPANLDPWFEYLVHRFTKYDSRQHKHVCGSVSERDFVHVLQGRSGPVKVPVETATEILAQFLRVSCASSPSTVLYHEFLRLLRDCREPPSSPSKPHDAPAAPHFTPAPKSFTVTNVAYYLINDATDDERQHFEELMDVLHKFQQKVAARSASSGSPAPSSGSIEARRAGDHCSSPRSTTLPASDAGDAMTPRAGDISPVENGILLALGAKLQVRIQFATQE